MAKQMLTKYFGKVACFLGSHRWDFIGQCNLVKKCTRCAAILDSSITTNHKAQELEYTCEYKCVKESHCMICGILLKSVTEHHWTLLKHIPHDRNRHKTVQQCLRCSAQDEMYTPHELLHLDSESHAPCLKVFECRKCGVQVSEIISEHDWEKTEVPTIRRCRICGQTNMDSQAS
jgi:hypothetical protein